MTMRRRTPAAAVLRVQQQPPLGVFTTAWFCVIVCALLLLVHDGASAFAPLRTVVRRTSITNKPSTSVLFEGDGNPPPFGNWAPAPAAPAADSPPAVTPAFPTTSSQPPPQPPSDPYQQQAAAVAATPPPPAAQPAAPAAPASPAAPIGSGSGNGDPISSLAASQQASLELIKSAVSDLVDKPDLSWSSESIAGTTANLDAYDSPGASNIAWLGSLCVDNKISSMTIFNGPLTDVPHLLSRCCLDANGSLEFALDFRPRAYGAYELRDAGGNYPGPDELGRKAFEYSGARNDYFNKFATDELHAWLQSSVASLEDTTPIPLTELDRLTGGPLAVSLKMPATSNNIEIINQMRSQAIQYWIQWSVEQSGHHDHRPGAPINTQYVYDSKFRINAYQALLEYYQQLLGDNTDGAKLAAAESGPLDEAYVGGGS